MQTSSSLNEQHVWGGDQFTCTSDDTDNHSGEQSTVIRHGHRPKCFHEPPQGGIFASTSDDLFHPVSHFPSSQTFLYQTFLLTQIHVICPIVIVLLHILYLLLLIITHLFLFLQHLLMLYRLPLHLYLPIFLLSEWICLQHHFNHPSQPSHSNFDANHGIYPQTILLPSSYFPHQDDRYLHHSSP